MAGRGPRHLFLASQPILHEQNHAAIGQHGRQERRQKVVLRSFQCHHDDVTSGHLTHVTVGLHPWQHEIAVFRVHHQTVLVHVFEIAVEQKMYVGSRAAQPRTVESAQRARA
jgi:hypothetical protein